MQQAGREGNGKHSGASGAIADPGQSQGPAPALVPQDDPTRPGKANAFMPMYIGDMLRDTQHLTHAEFGAYHLLIYQYWSTREPLPDQDELLRRVARCTKAEWKRMGPTLRNFFDVGEGVWRHKRIDAEMAKAAVSAKRRRLAGCYGNQVRWGEQARQNDLSRNLEKPSSHCDPKAIAGRSQPESESEPESKPQPGRVAYSSMVPTSGRKKGEDELMRRCRELLGEPEMAKNGGLWRTRAREDGDKLSRTLDDLAAQLKEGKLIQNPAAYLSDLFKNRFASHQQEPK